MADTICNDDDASVLAGKVLSPAHMAHLVLRTAQFKPMVAFYTAFLGARVAYENPMICFLAYDDEHHRLGLANVGGHGLGPAPANGQAAPAPAPAPGGGHARTKPGLDHVAFTFSSLADLALAYRQRKARGIVPFQCLNHGVTTSMYYQDPDGNGIETQVDNFDSVAAAEAYMRTAAFTENPLGVDFDPEDLVRRLRDGEDEAAIKRRPNVGPRSVGEAMEKVPPPPLVQESYEPVFV